MFNPILSGKLIFVGSFKVTLYYFISPSMPKIVQQVCAVVLCMFKHVSCSALLKKTNKPFFEIEKMSYFCLKAKTHLLQATTTNNPKQSK